MYLDAAKKQEIFGKYGKSNTDTGSLKSSVCVSNPLLAAKALKREAVKKLPFFVSFYPPFIAIFVS